MRSFWKYSLVLLCCGLVLPGPLPALAAGVHFWVGLDSNRTEGTTRTLYVPVLVGTNETTNPQTFGVAMTVMASRSDGFQCTITTEVTSRFHPAVWMPVRFQVKYPAMIWQKQLPPVQQKQLPPVQYRIRAVIHNIYDPPVASTTQYQNEVTRDFGGGGTPQCVRLPCPPGANCYPPSN